MRRTFELDLLEHKSHSQNLSLSTFDIKFASRMCSRFRMCVHVLT